MVAGKMIVTAAWLLAAYAPEGAPASRPTASSSTPPPPARVEDDHARPAPGGQKTFGDWTVACDNTRRCAMASLGGADGAFPPVTAQLTRKAGPDGGYEIAIAALSDDTLGPAALIVDGRRFPLSGDGMAGAAARMLAAAIASGRVLNVRDTTGAAIGGISLAGAAAALRYIDAAQGRAGTVTATVATGTRTAATVPAATNPPRVRAIAPAGAAATLTPAQLAGMRRTATCEDRATQWPPRTQGLADGTTLVLLPCSSGAYNEIDALFVVRNGRIAPAEVDAPAGFEVTGADTATPVHSIVNGAVDGDLVTSYAKGRGLGDCGVTQGFVWDGRRLRLVEQRAMGECRGNPDYLTVWRATVVRP